MLRTLNYHKCDSSICANIPFIYSNTFEVRSTTSINDHSLFYVNKTDLRICLTKKRSPVTWSSPLFQHVTYLIIEMSVKPATLWDNLLNTGKQSISFLFAFNKKNSFLLFIDELNVLFLILSF